MHELQIEVWPSGIFGAVDCIKDIFVWAFLEGGGAKV